MNKAYTAVPVGAGRSGHPCRVPFPILANKQRFSDHEALHFVFVSRNVSEPEKGRTQPTAVSLLTNIVSKEGFGRVGFVPNRDRRLRLRALPQAQCPPIANLERLVDSTIKIVSR